MTIHIPGVRGPTGNELSAAHMRAIGTRMTRLAGTLSRLLVSTSSLLLLADPLAASTSGGYRGPQCNGMYPGTGLLREWPASGPALLWKQPLQQGYASVTVADKKVYIAGGLASHLHVFDLDGKRLKKIPIGSASWSRFGGTRSTPLVRGGLAVTTTPNANIYAIDLAKGQKRWMVNAWKSFGAGKGGMGWGLPSSPMLHDDAVIFNTCSRLDETPPLVALDMQTGKTVWWADAGEGKKYSAGDVSGAAFRHGGRDLVAYPTWRYLLCVEAKTGKHLWDIRSVGEKTLTPLYDDGLLLWGPGGKAQMLQLSPDGNTYEVLWTRHSGAAGWSHGAMFGGRVYLFSNPCMAPQAEDPMADTFKDRGTQYVLSVADAEVPEDVRKQGQNAVSRWKSGASRACRLLCLDARTGKLLQSHVSGNPGHIIAADGMVYVLDLAKQTNDFVNARMTLLEPTDAGFGVKGRFFLPLSPGELRWGSARAAESAQRRQWAREDFMYQRHVNPVIAEGRLFVRYGPLQVYDLRGPDYRELPAEPEPVGFPIAPPVPLTGITASAVTAADVPVLLAELGSRFRDSRTAAVAALSGLDPSKHRGLVPALAGLIGSATDRAWFVQKSALDVLRAMGPKARKAVRPLRKVLPVALASRDATLARLVLETLAAIDEAAPGSGARDVARLLEHEDPYVRRLAVSAAGHMGPAAKTMVPGLVRALGASDGDLAHAAASALGALGADAARGIPELREMLMVVLENKCSPHATLVMKTLGEIDESAAAPLAHRIAALLRRADPDVQYLAARALNQAGAAAAEAVPDLVRALQADDRRVSEQASAALKQMGPSAGAASEALARTVTDAEGALRLSAIEILTAIGPAAGPAVAALAKAVGDRDIAAARAAANALKVIGPGAEGAAGALTAALKHRDIELVRNAAAALGGIGPGARSAAPGLLGCLRHRDTAARGNAVQALLSMGESPVAALVALLDPGDSRLSPWAADELGRIGAAAADAVPALTAALASGDARLVSSSARSLGLVGHGAAPAVPALVAISTNADEKLTATIVQSLACAKTNNIPPRAEDVTAECEEGKTVTITLAASDPDDAAVSVVARVRTEPAHGTVREKGRMAFVYSATPGFVGEDSFTWVARDTTNESNAAKVTIPLTPDTTAPSITEVTAWGRSNRVVVGFDEPTADATSGDAANYAIDKGVRILAAGPGEMGATVVLTTTGLAEDEEYTLTVRRLVDRAVASNERKANITFIHKRYVRGVAYTYYERRAPGDELKDFDAMAARKRGSARRIDNSVKGRETEFSLRFDGLLNVPTDGNYTFYTSSDDGSRIYIDGSVVVKNDGMHGTVERSGTVALSAGMHPIVVTFYQGTGPSSLSASWEGPGIKKQEIPAEVLFHVP